MGDLVELSAVRAVRKLEEELRRLNSRIEKPRYLVPEDYGWKVARRAEDGEAIGWINLKYGAQIGYVPGRPEWTYLDYRHRLRAFALDISQLMAALETGTLPEPEFELDALGNLIDAP